MRGGGKQSKRDVCVYRQYKKKKKKKKTFFFFLVEACIHTALAFKEEKRFSGLRGVYSICTIYIYKNRAEYKEELEPHHHYPPASQPLVPYVIMTLEEDERRKKRPI